ncbi:M23 family metallopeptidase [Staphylococcus ratti]|uniref:lysostaphin n=1 Tax=Staphylococcus ratti TaxID=2892440 RepID=A0ABY3PCT0_9STAP|nr:M23 family metallopeptidase [Staphylococcus ratti]UEX90096.1 M23 family metallopeptidase [Staphylococcus ratti]
MKKIAAATIATVGFATFGIMHSDAEAAEQVQSSGYVTTFSQETNDYVTIDAHGNYHHTLDGNWNVSMFENGLYQSFYTDQNGHTHYVYYNQYDTSHNENDDTSSQTDAFIQNQGNYSHQPSNDASNSYRAVQGQWNVNTTDQLGHHQAQSRSTHSQAPAPQGNASASTETSQKGSVSTTDTSNKAAAGWLKKYPKWQPYGQYTTGGAHYGVDYGMPENTPVYSFTDGKVIQSGWSNYGGGNQITIQEANSNNYQWYMHMNQLNVKAGDTVTKGQQIGLSGSTGNSTGPHLHFQRMSGGIGNQYAVNPDNYLANQ